MVKDMQNSAEHIKKHLFITNLITLCLPPHVEHAKNASLRIDTSSFQSIGNWVDWRAFAGFGNLLLLHAGVHSFEIDALELFAAFTCQEMKESTKMNSCSKNKRTNLDNNVENI